MDANLFIPACLPLLADTTLTQTLIEYEQTRLHVTKPDSPFPKQLHDKITEAILAVSDELVRRSRAVEQTVSASSVLSTRIQIPVPPTVQTSSII